MFFQILYFSEVDFSTGVLNFSFFHRLALLPLTSYYSPTWILQSTITMKDISQKATFILSTIFKFNQALNSNSIQIFALKIFTSFILNDYITM